MTEEQINKIIGMNQQLLLLLGFSTGLIATVDAYVDPKKCEWFHDAITNLVYLDKPIPPMPRD